jgi:uncharacterized protein YqgC (DUF456 family)
MVPGALVSLGGVGFYRWQTGEPGGVALVVVVGLAVTAVVLDYASGAVSARAGGASWGTTAVAALSGVFLAVFFGPLGFVVGTAGVVFVSEMARGKGYEGSKEAAFYTTAGIVLSTVFRFLLNLLVLVVFVASAVL